MIDSFFDFPVTDRYSFIKLIYLMRQDLINNPSRWENKKLEDYFDALASYTEDIQGYYNNTKQQINADEPNWQNFANMLKGASIYE